jgi:PHD/YefM family antitoxin component YafN of YafNO toxin-antitoxin module
MDLKAEKLELVRLLIETNNKDIIKKIKSLLTSEKLDETSYLLSSEANQKHLEEGILQDQQKKYTVKKVDELWK